MNEDSPSRKKRRGWLKQSHSDPRLTERAAIQNDPSSPLPLKNPRGLSRLVPKLLRKATDRSAPSTRQSSNVESAAAGSSAQGLPPIQTTKDLSPLTAPIPEPNPDQASNSGIAKAEQPDIEERIANATKGMAGMKNVSGMVQNIASSSNDMQSIPDTVDTFAASLAPLKVFSSVANGLADLHPYAKMALSIFTCAAKMVLDQAKRDDDVLLLLTKMSEVYVFIKEDEALAKIQSMLAIYGKIARQILECADFIVHYSETKSAWKRLGKHITDETDAMIQSYSVALDGLMQQFRDRATRDAAIILHRAGEDLDFSGMVYSDGAGFDTSKLCLPGTREEILSEIKSWICSTGEDVPRVLWLSGTAGKGKSAIAHTIASWSNEQGGLGACFCFDRTRGADRRHEKIFTTIARDLADCDPIMRRALARAVHDRNELRHTTDIKRQWLELIVGPTGMTSKDIAAPVLIVIEALDESGEANSREQILRLLAGKQNVFPSQVTELPENIRILVTSRPLEDIHNALLAARHVRHLSLDSISSVSTEQDIQLYISHKLQDLCNVFDDDHFKALALRSDGLFEWARLASEYIKSTNIVSRGPMRRFRAISETSTKGAHLLDEMYQRILADIMPGSVYEEAIPLFRSVMGQILASSEPLPITALAAMRQHFSCDGDPDDVHLLMRHLGSLVSGTSDLQTPIRPLHASFYDFLTDKSRSRDFFVDASLVHSDLAFASLRVMERGLRFNICSLESSYLPNSSVPDLEKRVKESIPTELSYSCRFWGTHVGAASFEPSLAKEVEDFFDDERLLWWLEALALMKGLSGSVRTLLSIAKWVKGHANYKHISDAASDSQRFVRIFGATILHSTPHLYLSALPFAATQLMIFKKFAAKFPCTLRIVAGHVLKWSQVEQILHGNDEVYSVVMSQDGKRLACGLYNGTIQVWDMETGELLGAPFEGHTSTVASVAFSPDGNHIVSGSWDMTVRVWDAATGKTSGAPFRGHTGYVQSVAISQDGKFIVSGSDDTTIQVWDMGSGKALGAPLRGHTDRVVSVAISSDGKSIVSSSGDDTIRVWDKETGDALGAPFRGHTGCVRSVAISQDGKFMVSGSDDYTIRLWDKETGEALGAPLQGHTGPVYTVAISPAGDRVVSGSDDQTIRVWDITTRETLGSPLQGHAGPVYSVTISPDGSRIVSGSYDKTILVWDTDTHTSEVFSAALQGHTDSVGSVAISPDGNRIVSGSYDKTIRVWEMGTGKALGTTLQGHTEAVISIATMQHGNRIVSGSNDNTIRVWDMGTGKVLGAHLQGHATAISPDKKHFKSGLGDNMIRVRDVETETETGDASDPAFRGHTDWVLSVAISRHGRHIVSGSRDMTIGIWDVETKASAAYLRGHTGEVFSIAISPDSKHIVSGSGDKTIGVWNMETKTLATYLRGHTDKVFSVAISPDGKYIVSGSFDKTIRVWDMETGESLVSPLQGHTGHVCSVAVSPDGKNIVSGSADKTIRVWGMETGEALGFPLRGHTALVVSVAISPDGKKIVSGSYDRTIRVWDLNPDQLLKAPAICFSSDPTHALYSPSSFLQGSRTPSPLILTKEGWVVGPEGQILLSIPLHFYPAMYFPGNTLVIHDHPLQLDLRRFAHGISWHKCRAHEAALSS